MNGNQVIRRVLVCPDKFKGTMTAPEAAKSIRDGVIDALPDVEVRTVPIADGGEGTVDAVIAVGGTARTANVDGPLGVPVRAKWAMLGTTAVIEVAAASGLALVSPDQETALRADTFGTGQLISQALDAGCQDIVLGLGGSATTDGGMGIIRALGGRLLDENDQPVPPGGGGLVYLRSIDLRGLDPRLADVPIRLCCDVASPLLGPNGAASVFGPQKGASPDTVRLLEIGLGQLARYLAGETGRNAADISWGGAAGGTAGGLYAAIDASFQVGTDAIADLLGLDQHLRWADLLIVGEGSLDVQSLAGKAPIGAARRAVLQNIGTAVVAGRIDLTDSELAREGIVAAVSLVDVAGSAEAACEQPSAWVRTAAKTLMQSIVGTAAVGSDSSRLT